MHESLSSEGRGRGMTPFDQSHCGMQKRATRIGSSKTFMPSIQGMRLGSKNSENLCNFWNDALPPPSLHGLCPCLPKSDRDKNPRKNAVPRKVHGCCASQMCCTSLCPELVSRSVLRANPHFKSENQSYPIIAPARSTAA